MRLTVGGHSATAWNTPASSTQPFCLRPCLLSVRTALFGQFGSNEMVTGLAAMIACRAADSWGDFTTLASDSSGVIPMAIPFSRRKKRPPGALPLGVAGLSPQQAWGPLLHSFYDQCSDHGWGHQGSSLAMLVASARPRWWAPSSGRPTICKALAIPTSLIFLDLANWRLRFT